MVVDAVYDAEFLRKGFVPLPIIATNVVEDHLDQLQGDLWVYYCQGQNLAVANRFIAMPSVRNRVIGHQLFARGVSGFLHWGFNFYYSWHARGGSRDRGPITMNHPVIARTPCGLGFESTPPAGRPHALMRETTFDRRIRCREL
jgi:glycosyl hydrolase family 123